MYRNYSEETSGVFVEGEEGRYIKLVIRWRIDGSRACTEDRIIQL